jgi:hypothetical protein
MTRRRQARRKTQKAARASQTTRTATAKKKPARENQVRAWFAGVLAAVIAATSPLWGPALASAISGLFSSASPGPALTATAEPASLADQGATMATPDGVLASPQLLHLMAQAGAVASPAFLSDVRAMGGADVNDLSIELIVNGNSPQGVRITGISPVRLQRTKPLGGTLFYVPSQGASASLRMMFDLDEPVPVARHISHPPCRDITQGDTVRCAVTSDPYPRQPLAADAGNGPVDPGSPFFRGETITLADHEQQVLDIRAQVTRTSATFDLDISYIVGTASTDYHQLVVSDGGQPFRVTGMPSGTKSGTVSYQAAYTVNGSNDSMCPVPDPRLIALSSTASPQCQS